MTSAALSALQGSTYIYAVVMILYYAHSMAYTAIMAESDLQEDMAEALWSCFRRRNMGKLQIALYNPNVTPDMLLPPDTQAENPCCNERKNIPC